MSLNLADFLDEVVSSEVVDSTVTQAVPSIQEPIMASLNDTYKETYGKAKLVKRPMFEGKGKIVDATVDPLTGKIKVLKKDPVPEFNPLNSIAKKDGIVNNLLSKAKPLVSSDIPDSFIDDAIDMAGDIMEELDPYASSKAAAIKEDSDRATKAVRARAYNKIEKFKKSMYCSKKFDHSVIPSCYKELSIDSLNEVLEIIRDQIGRSDSRSFGSAVMKVIPTLAARSINTVEGGILGSHIDEAKFNEGLDNNNVYQTGIEEIDIDYFETGYSNPWMRVGTSLIGQLFDSRVRAPIPQAVQQPQPMEQKSVSDIIAESETNNPPAKVRREILD